MLRGFTCVLQQCSPAARCRNRCVQWQEACEAAACLLTWHVIGPFICVDPRCTSALHPPTPTHTHTHLKLECAASKCGVVSSNGGLLCTPWVNTNSYAAILCIPALSLLACSTLIGMHVFTLIRNCCIALLLPGLPVSGQKGLSVPAGPPHLWHHPVEECFHVHTHIRVSILQAQHSSQVCSRFRWFQAAIRSLVLTGLNVQPACPVRFFV